MSLQIFKSNMVSYMQNQNGIDSSDDFAEKITNEYDLMIKSGFQTVNNVPLQSGNKKSMESFVKIACQSALSKTEGQHNFIDDIGKSIIQYWLGAKLIVGIPPVIPAVGAIQNISTSDVLVINPGQWSPFGPTPPTDDINIFLDILIAGIQSHLPTIQFLYNTTSLYPSIPAPVPAPGILQATGYTIPS